MTGKSTGNRLPPPPNHQKAVQTHGGRRPAVDSTQSPPTTPRPSFGAHTVLYPRAACATMSSSSSSTSTSTSTGQSTRSTHTTRPLPPGTILGPDGKPCKICTSFRNWKPPTKTNPTTTSSTGKKSSDDQGGAAARAIASATALAASASAAGAGWAGLREDDDDALARRRREAAAAMCPPDVDSLGRATWTFLHTTAAYYPDRPTPTQRAHMLQLLHALPQLYPCSHCAGDLGDRIRRRPPDVRSRSALSTWLCETHNEVNAMLGKPAFDCARVDERWRDGPKEGSCD